MADNFMNKLQCIHCGSGLKKEKDDSFSCSECMAKYPIKFNIPSMLTETAKDQEWNAWDNQDYLKMGNSYYQRASGELPEKEASKSYVNIIKRKNFYGKGESLLDIGAACGHFYRSFRDRLDPEIDYTGVDITFNFLKWGREVYPDENKVHFVHCDALKLPFISKSFDTVIVNLFHFFPRLDLPLFEAMRVAKKRILWRTPIGEANYAIKIIYDKDFNKIGVIEPNRDDYDSELWMIYQTEYLEGLIASLGGKIEFIERDLDFKDFNNNDIEGFDFPSSKSVSGVQTAGSIILDWHYVSILPA